MVVERKSLDAESEFSKFCPALEPSEIEDLALSLKDEGCRDPIRYWDNGAENPPIVDGHHRYRLCIEQGVLYQTEPMQFADRLAVLNWMAHNQIGRRNLTPVGKSLLVAKLFEEQKAAGVCPAGTSEPNLPPPSRNVARHVAQTAGVSERAVHKAAKFAKALDKLGAASPKLHAEAVKGHIAKLDAEVIAEAPVEVLRTLEGTPETDLGASVKAVANEIRERKPLKLKAGAVVTNNKALVELENLLGKCVRLKSDAFEAMGGKNNPKAVDWEAEVRHHLNQIFDAIVGIKGTLA